MITIKEIARRAGVSIGTVDRVLHKRGRVSDETARTIESIVGQSGYQTNIFARTLSYSRSYRLGVIMPRPNQDSGYWELPLAGAQKAAGEIAAYGVQTRFFFYDRFSVDSFKKAQGDVAGFKPDGLLAALVIPILAEEFLAQTAPRISVVLFDSDFPLSNRLSYIGQDSFQSGLLSGKLVHLLLAGKGGVAIIQPRLDDFHLSQRRDGFLHYFTTVRHRCSFEVCEMTSTHDRAAYWRAIQRASKRLSGLAGIFVTDASAHIAAAYLEHYRLEGKVGLVGHDMIEPNAQYLRNGTIGFLISQKPEVQGYEGLFDLYRGIVLRKQMPKKRLAPLEIFTKENANFNPGESL